MAVQLREKWLLSILTGVFFIQSAVLVYGVGKCFHSENPKEACPQLGDRFENTFNGMIATTLALLTGATVATATRKPSTPRPPKINVTDKTN